MSCALTIEQVRARTKTVTRRAVDTWAALDVGDELVLIEKGMGLRKGERHVVLAVVEIVSVSVEPLGSISAADVTREGFPDMSVDDFCRMWLISHKHRHDDNPNAVLCRRIEWEYRS